MKKYFGKNVKIYRDTVIRRTKIDDNSIIADDVFITDSCIGKNCTIERRNMIFNSVIRDYSYTGYNTVIKYADVGKFCSFSWNCSLGGADHYIKRLTTHPFPFDEKFGIQKSSGGGIVCLKRL